MTDLTSSRPELLRPHIAHSIGFRKQKRGSSGPPPVELTSIIGHRITANVVGELLIASRALNVCTLLGLFGVLGRETSRLACEFDPHRISPSAGKNKRHCPQDEGLSGAEDRIWRFLLLLSSNHVPEMTSQRLGWILRCLRIRLMPSGAWCDGSDSLCALQ